MIFPPHIGAPQLSSRCRLESAEAAVEASDEDAILGDRTASRIPSRRRRCVQTTSPSRASTATTFPDRLIVYKRRPSVDGLE